MLIHRILTRPHSLRRFTTLLIVSASFILALMFAVIFFVADYKNAQAEISRAASIKATYLGELVMPALIFSDLSSAKSMLDIAKKDPKLIAVTIFDKNDAIFARFTRSYDHTNALPAGRNKPIQTTLPLYDLGQLLGKIEIHHTSVGTQQLLLRYIYLFFAMTLAGLFVGIILTWVIRHFITDAISSLAQHTDSITKDKQYNQRIKVSGFKEIRRLSQALNAMFDAVQSRDKKLKAQTAELDIKANYDALTLLPNRYRLYDKLDQFLAAAQANNTKLAILLIDLDRFKFINDSLGHIAGDALLKTVTQRIQTKLAAKHLFARWGGDEFVVIIPQLNNTEEAEQLAKAILYVIAQETQIDSQTVNIASSIGISIFPDHALNRDALLSCADIGMYSGKTKAGNSYALYSSAIELDAKDLQLENKLRKAITNDTLEVYYQAKLAVDSKKIVGLEALIRWQDTDLGCIPPDQFIPLAEELGLINNLTILVFEHVARDFSRWQSLGIKTVPVAINISPSTLLHSGFIAELESRLLASTLDWQDLEIEITEEVFLYPSDEIIAVLSYLRDKGIKFALDDFGTRYSTLANLAKLPIDMLKIDGVFIAGLEQPNDKNHNIVSAIIKLAHGLSLQVLAECVELPKQFSLLQQQGCDQVQGFLFHRPLTANDCAKILSDEHPSS